MPKPILYEFPPTRSNRAKWALEELGIGYESRTVDFMKGEQQSGDYKKIHPLGKVPALKTDLYEIHESVAILMQLLDEHPEKQLAPPPGSPLRALYYQWCCFSAAEMDHNLNDVMKHTMHLSTEQRNAEIGETAVQNVNERCEMLSTALKDQNYLLGDTFSGADIAVGYAVNWVNYVGLLEAHPRLVQYLELLRQRPAFQRVFLASA